MTKEDVLDKYELTDNRSLNTVITSKEIVDNLGLGFVNYYLRNLKSLNYKDSSYDYSMFIEYIISILENHNIIELSGLDMDSSLFILNEIRSKSPEFFTNQMNSLYFLKMFSVDIQKELIPLLGKERVENSIASILDIYYYDDWFKDVEKIGLDKERLQEKRRLFYEYMFERYGKNDPTLVDEFANGNDFFYSYYYEEKFNGINDFMYYMFVNYLSDYQFGSLYNNFVNLQEDLGRDDVSHNINQIINFNSSNPCLYQDRIDFYRMFQNLEYGDRFYLTRLFELYKGYNSEEVYQGDLKRLQALSHKLLVDECTSFDKSQNFYNKELSSQYGVDVYYLDGEDFHAFARSDVKIEKKGEVTDSVIDASRRFSTSFTYIGTEGVRLYKDPSKYLTILYRVKDPSAIAHVNENDSWSLDDGWSDCCHTLHTPKSLLDSSEKYPEINIVNPDALERIGVLTFDDITAWDRDFASKAGLPIIMANSEKYTIKKRVY